MILSLLTLLFGSTAGLDMQEAERSLTTYAKSQCDAEKVSVSWLGLSDRLPGKVGMSFHWTGNPCQSKPVLRVRGVENGTLIGTWRIRPGLDIWKQVPVAAADTQKNQKVVAEKGLVLVQDIRGIPVGQGNWVAAKDLEAGEPLTDRVVRLKPDSLKGSVVRVESSSGSLTVASDGRLMEDAFLNSDVRVLILATRTMHKGRLVASNKVILY